MAKCPNGPSVKFLVNAVHTMEELKLTGNHLKGSRPLLTFSTNFDRPPLETFERDNHADNMGAGSESDSTISSETDLAGPVGIKFDTEEVSLVEEHKKEEMTLLDLYSGCGAMSTGLCLGSNMSGVNLVTNPDPAIAEAPKKSKTVESSRNKRIGDF